MQKQVMISDVLQKVGVIIQYHRKKESLTQQELALRINASRPTISSIENGKGKNLIAVFKLFKYFNLLEELSSFYDAQLDLIKKEQRLESLHFYD